MLNDVLDEAAQAPGRGCMLGNAAAELLPGDEEAGGVVAPAQGRRRRGAGAPGRLAAQRASKSSEQLFMQ
jgi:TetR/AcrR family transcriptional repressor of nem operon